MEHAPTQHCLNTWSQFLLLRRRSEIQFHLRLSLHFFFLHQLKWSIQLSKTPLFLGTFSSVGTITKLNIISNVFFSDRIVISLSAINISLWQVHGNNQYLKGKADNVTHCHLVQNQINLLFSSHQHPWSACHDKLYLHAHMTLGLQAQTSAIYRTLLFSFTTGRHDQNWHDAFAHTTASLVQFVLQPMLLSTASGTQCSWTVILIAGSFLQLPELQSDPWPQCCYELERPSEHFAFYLFCNWWEMFHLWCYCKEFQP